MVLTGWPALVWLRTASTNGAFLLEHRRGEEPMTGIVVSLQVNEKNQSLIIEWLSERDAVRRINFNCFVWDVTIISPPDTNAKIVSLRLQITTVAPVVDAPYPGVSLYTIVITG